MTTTVFFGCVSEKGESVVCRIIITVPFGLWLRRESVLSVVGTLPLICNGCHQCCCGSSPESGDESL